jgi:hypothetical protein
MNNTNSINFAQGEEMQFLKEVTISNDIQDVMNPLEVQKLRLDTCMSCQYVTADRQCTECGCPVVMMSQMNFKTCPKGYWS